MENLFSECIDDLKHLRCTVHSECDPSVSVALDKVIAKLEGLQNKADVDDVEVRCTVQEGLVIVSSILSCCASMADLMRSF